MGDNKTNKKEKEMRAIEVQTTTNPDCKECVKLNEQIKQLIYINQCKTTDIEELKLELKNLKKEMSK